MRLDNNIESRFDFNSFRFENKCTSAIPFKKHGTILLNVRLRGKEQGVERTSTSKCAISVMICDIAASTTYQIQIQIQIQILLYFRKLFD